MPLELSTDDNASENDMLSLSPFSGITGSGTAGDPFSLNLNNSEPRCTSSTEMARAYPVGMGEYDLLRELGKGTYGQYVCVLCVVGDRVTEAMSFSGLWRWRRGFFFHTVVFPDGNCFPNMPWRRVCISVCCYSSVFLYRVREAMSFSGSRGCPHRLFF